MRSYLVLDCTLRDGGYVNSWDFSQNTIKGILTKLVESNTEIIECGFLSQKKAVTPDKSIYRSPDEINKLFDKKPNSHIAAMINFGEFNIEDLPPYNGGALDSIRVAFHKTEVDAAVEYCKRINELGYCTYVQPMVTLNYTDEELISLIKAINPISPRAFYIVDSFGTMRKKDVLRMFYLIDNNLNPNIAIGFHSHNNMQLSFSNTQELLEQHTQRELIIDSSVYGMGRGAGNLCTELVTKYINENYQNKYDIIPILEIIDEYLIPIFLTKPWGYSVPFYIASINNCHPNYASFLLDKQTITIKDIHNILKSIDDDNKNFYDEKYIEQLYIAYQQHIIDDSNEITALKQLFLEKDILLLAPGKTIITEKEKILEYISQNNPITISINFIPDEIPTDVAFISNHKRFTNIKHLLDSTANLRKVIATSNISKDNNIEKISVINYSDYLCDDPCISDNSGMMILNLIKKIGVSNVTLAGFDGFCTNRLDNYYNDALINGVEVDELINKNNAISQKLQQLSQIINITFLTTSNYN